MGSAYGPGRPGHHPDLGLDLRPGDAAIGVDVGGTKTAIGLIDAATLTLLATTVIPTGRERGGEAVLADVVEQVRSLGGHARALGRRVAGVGVVVPENVSVAGRITSGAVLPGWNELPVAERIGVVAPVVIDSDVRAAALAEARLGAGRDYGFHAFMTISTGISYCAVIGGRPFAGAHGGALHLGTSVLAVLPDGTEVTLERLASGGALAQRYSALGATATRAEEVVAAAAVGDQAARDVVDSGARALGLGIALLLNTLDPEAVITGGGLGSADTEYWSSARRWARHYAHDHAKATPVVRGRLGPDAGVIGAAITGLSAAGNGRAAGGVGAISDNGQGTNATHRKK
jgi:glucokinase